MPNVNGTWVPCPQCGHFARHGPDGCELCATCLLSAPDPRPLPNPGSAEAQSQGCSCDPYANHHGVRCPYPPDGWIADADCPVHGCIPERDPGEAVA